MKKALQIFAIVVVLANFIPFLAVDYWWIRGFDFPHLQLTFLTLIVIFSLLFGYDVRSVKDNVIIGLLFVVFGIQVVKIFPYTTLATKEIRDTSREKSIRNIVFYTANVLQTNTEFDLVSTQIRKYQPDILVLLETNRAWQNAIEKSLSKDYQFSQKVPLENTYGMLFYSKLPLINPSVKFLVNDSIPSIHTKVLLKTGDTLQVYAIHPTPPMPTHNPTSTDRDAEMMKIALASLYSDVPVVVMGDFNDVAWSQTTSLFEEVSGLLDLRKGRGMFNTYHAKSSILRWPLDHLFVSEHFELDSVFRGEEINSDHFPVVANLVFNPNKADEQRMPPPSDNDLKQAKEIAERVDNPSSH